MKSQNKELTSPFYFVNEDWSQLATIQDLSGEKINRDIYFRPTSFPRINRFDTRDGSCFQGWTVPTPAFVFEHEDGKITDIQELETDLSLNEYKQRVDQEIRDVLTEVYDTHHVVNLMYSGGLDSAVILAYIMAMGVAKRTNLICINNTATQHPKSLRYDPARIENIKKFFAACGHLFHATCIEETGLSGIVNVVNDGGGYYHLQNYSTSTLYQRYQDQAWVGGQHGNRTLLHQWIFLDQQRIYDPENNALLQQNIEHNWQSVYSDSINRLDFSRPPRHLKWISHAMKTFDGNNGYHGNYLYMPLGTERMFHDLRRLDARAIPFDVVADATFGKGLIAKNSPSLLDHMDKNQSSYEFNIIDQIPRLPFDQIDPAQLWIPDDLNHDTEGLQWIHYELDQARETNQIELNLLISIKNLQYISTEINNSSSATFL